MPIRPGARSLVWSTVTTASGVLLLHGFTGSPASMRPWGELLAQRSWTVRVPRLPGHGTRWQDMNITRWEDWYSEADRNLRELTSRCDRVFVAGLSMGGALTLPACSGASADHLRSDPGQRGRPYRAPRPPPASSGETPSSDRCLESAYDIAHNRMSTRSPTTATPLKAAASMMEMWVGNQT